LKKVKKLKKKKKKKKKEKEKDNSCNMIKKDNFLANYISPTSSS
jgi:hypothetical protein